MASQGYPSLTALLGLLAIAGYQNRDKLAEMFGGVGQSASGAGRGSVPQTGASASGLPGNLGGLLGGLGGAGGSNVGGFLSEGLRDLYDRFREAGQGDKIDSWISTGPNKEIAPHEIEQAIDPDTLATLSRQTGLSREELLARLSRELPRAVDRYTPEGRLPSQADFSR